MLERSQRERDRSFANTTTAPFVTMFAYHRGMRFATVPLLCVLGIVILIAACGNNGEATGSTCPSGSTLTYESFGQAFMTAHCTECHSPGRGQHPLLDTVAEVRANATTIDRLAAAGPKATNDVMPDNGDVAVQERKKLGEWLACGAP